jgi:thiosulfate dehydrogenase [quinone] large subunit
MHNKKITVAATVLRLLLGWYLLVDGVQILMTPGWSAAGFLKGALTFPHFYAWFAMPINSWWVDPLNSWGITLIGVALILGVGIKPAAWGAAVMHILYYFPHYAFPIVPHGYIVEEHIIYAAAFVLIALMPQAQTFGFGGYLRKNTFLGRIPVLGPLV